MLLQRNSSSSQQHVGSGWGEQQRWLLFGGGWLFQLILAHNSHTPKVSTEYQATLELSHRMKVVESALRESGRNLVDMTISFSWK